MGATGISATVGYGQQITEGAGCGIAVGAKGYGGAQFGGGGLLEENEGFWELGLQSPGASCYWVGGRLGD